MQEAQSQPDHPNADQADAVAVLAMADEFAHALRRRLQDVDLTRDGLTRFHAAIDHLEAMISILRGECCNNVAFVLPEVTRRQLLRRCGQDPRAARAFVREAVGYALRLGISATEFGIGIDESFEGSVNG